jgi:HK97 family phage portal protein
VYRAITSITNAAGSVDLKLARRTSGDKNQPVTSGVEYDALMRPSSDLSTDMFVGQVAGWMQMACGEAMIRVIREGSARRLVLMSPDQIDVKVNSDLTLRYDHTPSGQQIPADEIIHIKQPFNPYDSLRGIGPLQAAAMAYQDDFDTRKYNRTVVRAGGMPAGFLSAKGGAWPTKEQQEQFKLELQKVQHLAQKVVLIGDGQWQTAGQTPEEMAFIEMRKLGFKEVGGVFGVPPQMLGDYERDQADAFVQMLSFHLDTMRPLLRLIADVLTLNLWKIRGTRYLDDGLYCYFDDSQVPAIAKLTNELAESDRADVQAGMTTINRVLEKRDQEPVDWGDVWWGPWGPVSGPALPELPEPKPAPADGKAAPAVEELSADELLNWHSFILQTTGYELAVVAALNEVWKKAEREAIAELRARLRKNAGLEDFTLSEIDEQRASDDESIRRPLFDIRDIAGDVATRTVPHLRATQIAGGKRGLRLARRAGQQFRVDARPAIEQLARQVQRFAIPVTETTWEKVKATLTQGLAKGESESKLVERVQRAMEVRRSEAARTARTEVSAAMNGGVALGFEQSEVVETKRWLTAGDEHVRQTHRAANGQERSVVDAFRVGGEELDYPGDPDGSAAEVIECRCTIAPGKIRSR